ncbi:MAG: peptidyl-prolyl cis-trans isomerase [Actinobacteria bacterium]|nr:peptidyl-prolyl cis-trans isomerase [Actinomycetota bacterium]
MSQLVRELWSELEAGERGITASDSEVRERYSSIKSTPLPNQPDFERMLERTGQTEAEMLSRIKRQLLYEKVRSAVKNDRNVTDQEIADEHRLHRSKYLSETTRDLRIVFTTRRDPAVAAFAALESGDSWSAVAKRYSEDPASKADNGRFLGVVKGQFEPKLDKAVFKATRGEIVGPIKTQFGFYVFAVTKITQGKPLALAQASPRIKQMLQSEGGDQRLKRFEAAFTVKWRARTSCRAEYHVPEVCR